MFGDIYPMSYMGKTTDMFGKLKFWLPVNLPFQAKTYVADRVNKIELLMLALDIMVISRLKNTQWHFYRIHGMP